jgi:hypothetical protein
MNTPDEARPIKKLKVYMFRTNSKTTLSNGELFLRVIEIHNLADALNTKGQCASD